MRDSKYNSSDLDAIRALRRSLGWLLVSERYDEELERMRLSLEQPGKGDYERGQVKAIRTLRDVPEILEHEIKSQVKE